VIFGYHGKKTPRPAVFDNPMTISNKEEDFSGNFTSFQDLPNESDFKNQCMVNFQTFLFNTAEEKERLSNAIDFWDSIPRYSVTRRQQNLLRDKKTGTLPKHVLRFCFKGETFKVEISPAKIDVNRGDDEDISDNDAYDTLDYYPSNREELVEEALRKIACRCSNGFMKQKPVETSGVVFSLYELLEELSSSGHEFSYRQIIESLNILNSANIKIISEVNSKSTKGMISSTYLPTLAAVSRYDYLTDTSSKWLVCFHPFVTEGIAMLAYRQFNYKLTMELSTQLSRWFHRYLCIKFTNAGMASPPFEIYYKTIKRDSGLLTRKTERHNFNYIEQTLDELKQKGILYSWSKKEILGQRNKKIDAIYLLHPSVQFVRETKASNKRKKDAVDNSLISKK